MVGGMEFPKQRADDLQVTDMIPVYLLDLDLGVKRTQKSILVMIGRRDMEVNLERGMMHFLKMLRKSLNFY